MAWLKIIIHSINLPVRFCTEMEYRLIDSNDDVSIFDRRSVVFGLSGDRPNLFRWRGGIP